MTFSSNNLLFIATNLKSKVGKLIFLNEKQEKEIIKLLDEKEELLKQAEDYKNTINKLEEKNKVLKLAKAFSEVSENSSDVKKKISELVREIDKCIALLNK